MKVRHEELGDILLPDFLLVGAAKSATTSLHHYLNQHPQVRMPTIKESWFFSFVNNPPRYSSPGVLCDVVSSLDEYVKLFEGAAEDQCLGDASPSYLYTYEDSIRNIKAIYPADKLKDLKIIISLRDPVSRAFSQYYTFRRCVDEPLSFEEAIEDATIKQRLKDNWNIFYDYTGFGRYYEQVKAYQDAFGKEQVKVVLYDDITREPLQVFRSICEFIGVDEKFIPDLNTKHNDLSGDPKHKWLVRILVSKNPLKRFFSSAVKAVLLRLPRKPVEALVRGFIQSMVVRTEMPASTRQQLTREFSEDVQRLEQLIGRDLKAWRSDS